MFRSTLEQYPVAIGRSVSASGSQVQHEQLLLLFEVVWENVFNPETPNYQETPTNPLG